MSSRERDSPQGLIQSPAGWSSWTVAAPTKPFQHRLCFGRAFVPLFTTAVAASAHGARTLLVRQLCEQPRFLCARAPYHCKLSLRWREKPRYGKLRTRVLAPLALASKPDRTSDDSEDGSDDGSSAAGEPRRPEPIPSRKPQHQVPESVIDWNQEWKAFVRDGKIDWSQLPRERPAPTVWTRSAAQVRNFLQRRASVPSWRELSRDWRFWLVLLLTLSVLSSAWTYSELNGSPTIPPGMRAVLESPLHWCLLV
jgi:hypothetical protein